MTLSGVWAAGPRNPLTAMIDPAMRGSGRGAIVYPNGDRYEGQWLYGFMRHGAGILHYANGNVYRGQFRLDRRHGLGAIVQANGERRDGHWLDDMQDGEGSQNRPGLFFYSGSFKRGVFHGVGKIRRCDGTQYHGEWVQGQQHGKGYSEDKSDGNGRSRYNGFWDRGLRHGIGWLEEDTGPVFVPKLIGSTITLQLDGVIQRKRDLAKGRGGGTHGAIAPMVKVQQASAGEEETHRARVVFEGKSHKVLWLGAPPDISDASTEEEITHTIRNVVPIVKGVVTLSDGSRFENPGGSIYYGQFVADRKEGLGTMRYANQQTYYEGQWCHNKEHGEGKMVNHFDDDEEIPGLFDESVISKKETCTIGMVEERPDKLVQVQFRGMLRMVSLCWMTSLSTSSWIKEDLADIPLRDRFKQLRIKLVDPASGGMVELEDGTRFENPPVSVKRVWEGPFRAGLWGGWCMDIVDPTNDLLKQKLEIEKRLHQQAEVRPPGAGGHW